jgi:3-oxoacyl-[acyl-carrier-protein] synthase-1
MTAPLHRRYDTCVLAMGARTAVGLTALTAAAAVRAGISRLRAHDTMVDKESQPYVLAIEPRVRSIGRVERILELMQHAVAQVVPMLGAVSAGLPVYVAIPEEARSHGAKLAQQLGRQLPGARVATIAADHAAGVLALELACREIAAGRAEICAVVGADSYIDASALERLDDARQLASEVNHFGFSPGEGAGVLVIASTRLALNQRLPALAWIAAVATAEEPAPMGTEGVCTGVGLGRALSGALRQLRGPDELVHTTYCDINGQRYREGELAWASQRVPPGRIVDFSDFVAPADCWGDVGAASAPLLAVLAIASGQRGYAKGPRALVWTSSASRRERGAVILHLASSHEG